jgi:hypothetical protein
MGTGMTRFSLAAVLAVAVAACDAQVTSDYRGERMVEIRGAVVAESTPPAAEPALVWWTAGAGAGDGALATPVATEGAFPSAFTLTVYRRPPDAALVDVPASGGGAGPTLSVPWLPGGTLACQCPAGPSIAPAGGRIAIASVAALHAGEVVIGLAADYALVFVASGTALAPGYHLMRVRQGGPAAGALDCGSGVFLQLEECADGIQGTPIEIRIRG